jgi:hypothetical protein
MPTRDAKFTSVPVAASRSGSRAPAPSLVEAVGHRRSRSEEGGREEDIRVFTGRGWQTGMFDRAGSATPVYNLKT